MLDPKRFLLLRLWGTKRALELALEEALREAGRPAEGLKAFPEGLERVRRALGEALARLGEGPQGEGVS